MPSKLIHDDSERVGAWVAERVEMRAPWGGFSALGMERDGEIVAGIVMNNYNGTNAAVHMAVDKPGKDMLTLFKLFCEYAFVQCGLKRITGLVPSDKPDVVAFDKKIGFEEEFVMKFGAPDGADMHILVMWPEKCRWLNKE